MVKGCLSKQGLKSPLEWRDVAVFCDSYSQLLSSLLSQFFIVSGNQSYDVFAQILCHLYMASLAPCSHSLILF